MDAPSQIEAVATAALIPYARNAKLHSEAQVGQIAASIREFGFCNPVLIDAENGIIAGHGRVMAAQKLGLESVPCLRLSHLSETQKKAYIIADNRLAETGGGWDTELLALDIEDLRLDGFDIDLTGFDADALEAMFEDMESDDDGGNQGLTDPDDVPEPPAEPITKPGDVWLLGKHRIMCGDSTDVESVGRLMAGERADLCLTDPPYGVKRDKGFEGFGGFGPPIKRRQYQDDWDSEIPSESAFKLISKNSRLAIIFGGNFFAHILPRSTHWIFWDKKQTMPTFGDGELAWTNSDRKSIKKYEFQYNGLIGKEKERYHPTQKPAGLFAELLSDYSEHGHLVYEPFSGSGTTIMACEQTGRRCYAMELSPQYVDVAVKRWQAFTGKTAILESTGEPFPG